MFFFRVRDPEEAVTFVVPDICEVEASGETSSVETASITGMIRSPTTGLRPHGMFKSSGSRGTIRQGAPR